MSMLDVLSDSSKWCKNLFFDGDRCCLRGAIAKNFGIREGSKEEISYHAKLEASIKKLFPAWKSYNYTGYNGSTNLVPTFNNHQETTFEMVRAVIEDADLDEEFTQSVNKNEDETIEYQEVIENEVLVEV